MSNLKNSARISRGAAFFLLAFLCYPVAAEPPRLAPLETGNAEAKADQIELGRMLFFDGRLSGDATTSCATCHDPAKAFTDGKSLSDGYPGTLYFRNTPTLVNASKQGHFYWDGRMSGDDLPSLVRDHIAEAHFMQADGRLVIERLRQVPVYVKHFESAMGGEPSYGKILNAVSAFVRSLESKDVPLDQYLQGDKSALTESATRGLELFSGKADCIACHHGPLLTDDGFHVTGVPVNPSVFSDPERHITYRRFLRTIGVGNCATLHFDVGCGCVTKDEKDQRAFRTASLREVARTAPYMHNGMLESLEQVVDFYNAGGGDADGKDPRLKPLNLSADEKADLVEFLKALSGKPLGIEPVESPPYELQTIGDSKS